MAIDAARSRACTLPIKHGTRDRESPYFWAGNAIANRRTRGGRSRGRQRRIEQQLLASRTRPEIFRDRHRHWLFVFRPRVSIGYGNPFWRWVGIDANPAVSNKYLAGYAGLRLALPILEIRAGARYTRDWSQSYLAPLPGYDRLDFESQALPLSSYTNLEAEATGGFPLGPGVFSRSRAAPTSPAFHRAFMFTTTPCA